MADVELVDAVGAIVLEIQRRTIKKKRRIWTKNWFLKRNQLRQSQVLVKELLSEDPLSFLNMLGMNMVMFDSLLEKIGHNIQKCDTVMREALPAKVKLETACRYLATGESMASMQYLYSVPKCTISKFLPDVFDAIYEGLKEFIQIPATESDWKEIQKGFSDLRNFTDCVGCIGGKHVMVKCPTNLGSQYFNNKGTLCIVLLAMVDYNYNFTFIDIGNYGSIEDYGIFAKSSLMKVIEQNQINMPEGAVILGDSTFPSKSYSIKQYPTEKNLNVAQEIDNDRHYHAKRFVENSFDIFTSRFRVLRKPIHLLPETVVKMIKAACALHNWIRKSTNLIMTPDNEDNDCSGRIIPESWQKDDYRVDDVANVMPLLQHNYVPDTREKRGEFLKYSTKKVAVSCQMTEENDCLLKETEQKEEINTSEQACAKTLTSHPLPVLHSQHQSSPSQPTAFQPPRRINFTNQQRRRRKGGLQSQRKKNKFVSLDNAVNLLKNVVLQSPFTNEFTIFGYHVASQLKTLPNAEALQLQANIQSLITARVKYLQNRSLLVREPSTTNCSTSEYGKTHATLFSNCPLVKSEVLL